MKLTEIGKKGQLYCTTFEPRYLLYIESLSQDGKKALGWNYNAWGRLYKLPVLVEELREYEGNTSLFTDKLHHIEGGQS